MLRDPLQAASTICITMKFAKLLVHALLVVAFVQTGSALVRGEYEETGQCEVFLVLLVNSAWVLCMAWRKPFCTIYYAEFQTFANKQVRKLHDVFIDSIVPVAILSMMYFTLSLKIRNIPMKTENSRNVGLQRGGV